MDSFYTSDDRYCALILLHHEAQQAAQVLHEFCRKELSSPTPCAFPDTRPVLETLHQLQAAIDQLTLVIGNLQSEVGASTAPRAGTPHSEVADTVENTQGLPPWWHALSCSEDLAAWASGLTDEQLYATPDHQIAPWEFHWDFWCAVEKEKKHRSVQ